ncbi:hypothetical protein C8258_30930 [Nocardia sp. MDA0666]|uniref:hypothetical protein n=1 Tax=Nocardia sp. MDA0666 TaxID=2135448 RepID=UPI000D127EF6|nr:hypothetical protein [Nocardia sp. MDA0666]PSR58643.1 hypothetical protein C8258_30930 [Nocardia sp. MDA0666]
MSGGDEKPAAQDRFSGEAGNSYDDIERWFGKLAGIAPSDPYHDQLREQIIHLCLAERVGVSQMQVSRLLSHTLRRPREQALTPPPADISTGTSAA